MLHFIFIFFHSLNMSLGPALLKKGVYSIHIAFLPYSVAVCHLHGFPKVITLLHVGIHAIVSPLVLWVHIVYISKRSLCFLLILFVFSKDSQAIYIKLVYDMVWFITCHFPFTSSIPWSPFLCYTSIQYSPKDISISGPPMVTTFIYHHSFHSARIKPLGFTCSWNLSLFL